MRKSSRKDIRRETKITAANVLSRGSASVNLGFTVANLKEK